jgi:CRISPR-associated protein Csb2
MNQFLCITFRFIQPFPLFHGRADAEKPEWPPSPMRAFQALVNAVSMRARGRTFHGELIKALRLIESIEPIIVAPEAAVATVGHRTYVPNNQADLVTAAWYRGNCDASVASHRMEKDIRPMRLFSSDDVPAVHYLYPLDGPCDAPQLLATIRPPARSITALGWGIDQVAADAELVTESQIISLAGQQWTPTQTGGRLLRTPRQGSLVALQHRHDRFLNRLAGGDWTPVPPLRAFHIRRYRRDDEAQQHPCRVFELRKADGGRFRYPHRKLIHLAGMVRHLAIEAMKVSPASDVGDDWVETYVAGHAKEGEQEHRQLSYLPLPSVGLPHTDPGVRRIMIAAPVGDGVWLDHVARHLADRQLEPLHGDEFGDGDRPFLIPIRSDSVSRRYTQAGETWHSFTPVILPGHDDHRPEKTRKLIEKALRQSGVDQPCEFEWSEFSRFPKSFSAHKYDRQGRLTGYFRPDHLQSQTAVHMILRFKDGLKVPGPLAVGAGRHCGFGLFVNAESL